MRIVFVRHGCTEISAKNSAIQGQRSIPLNEEGKKESWRLGNRLKDEFNGSIVRIISSDVLRARETVNEMNRKLDVEAEYDERLREQDFGDATGKTMSEFKENHPEVDPGERGKEALYTEFPNGESTMDVYRRVDNFLQELIQRYSSVLDEKERIVVVSHTTPLHYVYFKAKDMDVMEKYGYLDTIEWMEVEADLEDEEIEMSIVQEPESLQ